MWLWSALEQIVNIVCLTVKKQKDILFLEIPLPLAWFYAYFNKILALFVFLKSE